MRSFHVLLALVPLVVAASSALAFELSWTDQFGETTYGLSGPDSVLVGETAEIVITARDEFYPNEMVAAPWRFLEDDVEVDGGFGLFLSDTTWQEIYTFVYEVPGSHSFTFTAQDLGHGSGGHSWQWFELRDTTDVVDMPTAVASFVEMVPPGRLQVFPNPAVNGTVLRGVARHAGYHELKVYDPAGRLIYTQPQGHLASGERLSWFWDGSMPGGVSASAGTYLIVVQGPGYQLSDKVVIIR